MEEKVMFINGIKINYYEQGEGFPFVLVHGMGLMGGGPHVGFQEILASHGFKTYMLDLPGFGRSWLPTPEWSTNNYVKVINDFVEGKGIEEFYLFGHSMGGTIVIRYAATYPQKVKALLLCAPGSFNLSARWMVIAFPIGYQVFLWLLRTLQFLPAFFYNLFRKRKPKWVENVHELFFRGEKWLAKFFKDFITKEKLTSNLLKLKSPTLVVWGTRDYVFPFFCVNSIGYIPDYNYSLKIIPDVGHSAHHDVPEEVARLICEFIENLGNKQNAP